MNSSPTSTSKGRGYLPFPFGQLREIDFALNRLDGWKRAHQGLGVLLLFAIVLVFTAFGPTPGRFDRPFTWLVVAVASLGLSSAWYRRAQTARVVQTLSLAIAGLGPILLDGLVLGNPVFLHAYLLSIFLVGFACFGSAPLASGLLRKLAAVPNPFATALKSDPARLPDQPDEPDRSFGEKVAAFFSALFERPLLAVSVPAILVLFSGGPPVFETRLVAPRWELIASTSAAWVFFVGSTAFAPWARALASVPESILTRGVAAVLTLLILVLALARLWGVDYVTTVLETESIRTISCLVTALYILLALYNFWVDRALTDALLRILEPDGSVPIVVKTDPDDTEDRALQLYPHGGERILAKRGERLRVWRSDGLFREIAGNDDEEAQEKLASIRLQCGVYRTVFALVPILATVALVGLTWSSEVEPGLTVNETEPVGAKRVIDLPDAIAGADPEAPLLFLTLSGGGTRAALHGAAALHAIHRIGLLDRLVLASGVSGGSASLAWFATHNTELAGAGREHVDEDWTAFRDAMAYAYIDDVLNGVVDLRLALGTGLGQLLTESFECRFSGCGRSATLGDLPTLGMIFNTTLCGVDESGADAGGQLLLTNLRTGGSDSSPTSSARGFEGEPESPVRGWKPGLPMRVLTAPDVPLAVAASLSANFPPLFSNVAVDVTEWEGPDRSRKLEKRYWVTDGGAVENLGLVSLLHALRASLSSLDDGVPKRLPPLHILVAEASLLNVEYDGDRGVTAKLEATSKLSYDLIDQLLSDVRRLHERISPRPQNATPGVDLVYLPLPSALRREGSFGTHWRLPSRITLPGSEGEADLDLSGAQLVTLVDLLAAPPTERLAVLDEMLGDAIDAGRSERHELRQLREMWAPLAKRLGPDDLGSRLWGRYSPPAPSRPVAPL